MKGRPCLINSLCDTCHEAWYIINQVWRHHENIIIILVLRLLLCSPIYLLDKEFFMKIFKISSEQEALYHFQIRIYCPLEYLPQHIRSFLVCVRITA